MALAAAVIWEIRTAGNVLNGGGFRSDAAGTDFSQQNAAQATLTVAATVHTSTTQLNVPAGEYVVSAADIGNLFQLSSGTATPGFYMIGSVDVANNRWTVDRSMGTAGQTAAGRMGGALSTPAVIGAVAVNGNLIWVKAGTYTLTTATQNIDGGPFTSSARLGVVGYGTTRGDFAARPLFTGSVAQTFFNNGVARSLLRNIECDGQAAVLTTLITWRGTVSECKATGALTGFSNATGACRFVRCEADAVGTGFHLSVAGSTAVECVAHGISVNHGFNMTAATTSAVRCIAADCADSGFLVSGVESLIVNCVAYDCVGDGFEMEESATLVNCVAEANAGYGFATNSSNANAVELWNCAGYSNTSGNIEPTLLSIFPGAISVDFVTGTASFFVDPANGDFALNNVSGGGAALRAAGSAGVSGYGGTSYLDIGAVQHEDAGDPTVLYVYNKAKQEIGNGTLDLDTSSIKATLVLATYVFDPDLTFIDDGTANDIASHEAAGVTRQTLSGRSVSVDNTNDFAYLSASDLDFPVNTGQSIGGVVIYRDTGSDATSVPIAFYAQTHTTTGADVSVAFAAAALGGALKLL